MNDRLLLDYKNGLKSTWVVSMKIEKSKAIPQRLFPRYDQTNAAQFNGRKEIF